jgi:alkylation response protein AidB-like acyl-CoA dehydrogenase
MKRLNLIKNQLRQKIKYVESAYDYLNFDDYLTTIEKEYRLKLRSYLEKEVKNQIIEYVDKTEFPYEIVRKLVKEFPEIVAPNLKEFGGLSFHLCIAVAMEIARIDMSLGAFLMVHGGEVVMKTIYLLGSKEQKEYYLPKLYRLELLGAFCLTEPEYGSDAYSIQTSALEDSDGNIIINGVKKWIGQGPIADLYIVWARNQKTNEIQGYLVEKFRKGLSSEKMKGKLGFRAVQNGQVYFDNVKIPKSNKLEKANDFSGISNVFLGSRIGVGFAVAGICIGAYDYAIKYLSEKNQFGKSLTSFQLVQDKLSRIMGNIQAVLFFTKRVSELNMQGRASIGMAGMLKSWCTNKGRETIALARELLGGDGILYENYIIKAMSDLEGLHTAEGTSEINTLVHGRELTGKLAIV